MAHVVYYWMPGRVTYNCYWIQQQQQQITEIKKISFATEAVT